MKIASILIPFDKPVDKQVAIENCRVNEPTQGKAAWHILERTQDFLITVIKTNTTQFSPTHASC